MDTECVKFLTEDSVLYSVDRYFFRDTGLLSRTAPDGSLLTPIRLRGVQSREFDMFLSIIYPSSYSILEVITLDEWKSVLRLAVKWHFHSIRELAKERLASLVSPIDKLLLSRQYASLAEWTIPAYVALCQRAAPLSIADGRRLGVDELVRVNRMRESVRSSSEALSDEEVACRVRKQLFVASPPPRVAPRRQARLGRGVYSARVVDSDSEESDEECTYKVYPRPKPTVNSAASTLQSSAGGAAKSPDEDFEEMAADMRGWKAADPTWWNMAKGAPPTSTAEATVG
ncbi:hypothetical protein BV25DRAFT_1919326 [Artomyces pyxidatus]|uniref:Uncharacterized protein n=1 Tax=Artomyces pyxidatus TaxID=48021 RepID=A0ACB8SQE0_9AGAM|nr:hypothetical protein BV25DRAFT_1919326 [Artomyces pyxidatus]